MKRELVKALLELDEQKTLKEELSNMKNELEKVRLELEGEKERGKILEDKIEGMQQIKDLDILLESDIHCGGVRVIRRRVTVKGKKTRFKTGSNSEQVSRN